MNEELISTIEHFAKTTIKIYDIKIPITNIDNVIKRIGGRVKNVSSYDRYYSNTKKENNSFTIEVPTYLPDYRRNYLIAFELGHVLLHSGFESDWTKWNSLPNTSISKKYEHLDTEAGRFAIALLLPQDKFKNYIYTHNIDDIIHTQQLAYYFKVSEGLVINRGQQLEVFK